MNSGTNINISHGVGFNQHHLEWCPKYRHDAMPDAQTAEEMKMILLQISSEKGIIVHKLVVDTDHVHMFVSLPLWMSVSTALQYLKGISARKIFQIHPEYRDEMFRKGSFWSPGHFSRSVSNVTASTVERYIDRHEYPKYTYDGTGHQTRMGRFM